MWLVSAHPHVDIDLFYQDNSDVQVQERWLTPRQLSSEPQSHRSRKQNAFFFSVMIDESSKLTACRGYWLMTVGKYGLVSRWKRWGLSKSLTRGSRSISHLRQEKYICDRRLNAGFGPCLSRIDAVEPDISALFPSSAQYNQMNHWVSRVFI